MAKRTQQWSREACRKWLAARGCWQTINTDDDLKTALEQNGVRVLAVSGAGAERVWEVQPPLTPEDVLKHWPRLTAHLICESLGYFTPRSAANAIAFHAAGDRFGCEWYWDWATKWKAHAKLEKPFDEVLRDVGREALRRAFCDRHTHKGYMANYRQAWALVDRSRQGLGDPLFASWF